MQRLCFLIAAMVIAASLGAQQSVYIEDLTWPEVQHAIATGKTSAIIYTGSSEQNGPHMVIGKHNFVAHYEAQRIAEELGDALVYPVLPFAITGNAAARTGHMRFPGSVTLPPEVFSGVVRAVAESAGGGVQGDGAHGRPWRRPGRLARVSEVSTQHRPGPARVLFIGDLYAKTDRQFTEVLAKRGLPTTDTRRHQGHLGTALPGEAGPVDPQGQARRGQQVERRPRCSHARLGGNRQAVSRFEGRKRGQANPFPGGRRQAGNQAEIKPESMPESSPDPSRTRSVQRWAKAGFRGSRKALRWAVRRLPVLLRTFPATTVGRGSDQEAL